MNRFQIYGLLIILIFPLCAEGQSWFEGNPQWVYKFNSWSCVTPDPAIGYINLIHEKDTIIDDLPLKHYKRQKVVNQMGDTLMYTHDRYFYEVPDKVFEYYNGGIHLIYDFTLEVGDTLKIETQIISNECDSFTFIVLDSIASIQIGDELLRIQNWRLLNNLDGLIDQFRIMEKVGRLSSTDFANPFLMDCSLDVCRSTTFECYNNKDLDIQYSVGACDGLVLSTDIDKPCRNLLFPNPANEYLNLYSSCELESLSLFNIEGILILKSVQKQINLTHLGSGVYFCRIQMRNGRIENQKIIIQ